MNKRTTLIFSLLLLTSALWSQNFGLAVQDQVYAPLINPAAMGIGNSGGIAYRHYFDIEEGFEDELDVSLSLGNLAYAFSRHERDSHLLAAGFPLGMGSYGGISYSWQDEDGGLGLSYMLRPTNFLSLAVRGRDLTTDAYPEFGVGLRPLFFSRHWISRLTLSGDATMEDGSWENTSAGAFIEAVDGMRIFSDYDFQDKALSLGLSLSYSHFELGSSLERDSGGNWNRGYAQASLSSKKRRCLGETMTRKAVEYNMASVISDAPVTDFFFQDGEVRSLMDFIMDMEALIRDKNTEALIFRDQNFNTSFANLLEIEALLHKVKESGKKIYFYYENAENLPYALAASVADGIYLNPGGTVALMGFGYTNVYLKDFLQEWGIQVHNYRSHDYKTAYDRFSESEMSAAEREAMEYLFSGLQEEQIRMMGGRAEKLKDSPRESLNQGPYIYASKALEMGLADALMYEDEFNDFIAEEGYVLYQAIPADQRMQHHWDSAIQPTVAVIYASGGIYSGEGQAGRSIGSDTMALAIRQARENPLVRGIILRVDSGGGSALASEIIAREVALCSRGKNPKPVIVSMGGSAASGGYYISAAADTIIASPATVTGSIGVITVMPDLTGFLEKYKIGTDTVKTAEHADAGNPFTALSDSEEEQIIDYIRENYDRFIAFVAEERGMSTDEVHEIAQGRIWTGTQAMERGLVDRTGGLSDALDILKEEIGVYKDLRIVEILPGSVPGIIERSLSAGALGKAGDILPEDLAAVLEMYEKLEAFEGGEALYLMPYSPEELGTGGRP